MNDFLPLIWIISRSSPTRLTRYENKRTDYPGINRVPEDQKMDVVGGSLGSSFAEKSSTFSSFYSTRTTKLGKPRNKKFRVH